MVYGTDTHPLPVNAGGVAADLKGPVRHERLMQAWLGGFSYARQEVAYSGGRCTQGPHKLQQVMNEAGLSIQLTP